MHCFWRVFLIIHIGFLACQVLAQTTPPNNATVSTFTLDAALLDKRAQSLAENAKVLAQEKQVLEQATQKHQTDINQLASQQVSESQIQHATLKTKALTVKLTELNLAQQTLENHLEQKRQRLQKARDTLLDLEKLPTETSEEKHQANLAQRRAQLELQQRDIDLDTKQLAQLLEQQKQVEQQRDLSQRWLEHLQNVWAQQQQQNISADLQAEQQDYLKQINELLQQLEKNTLDSPQRTLLNTQLHTLQTQLQRSQSSLQQKAWKAQLEAISKQPDNLSAYRETQQKLAQLRAQVIQQQRLQQEQFNVIAQQQALLVQQQAELRGRDKQRGEQTKQMLETLTQALAQDAHTLQTLLTTLDAHQHDLDIAYQNNLRQRLFRQRTLPQNEQQWQALVQDFARLPKLFLDEWLVTWRSLLTAMQHLTHLLWWLLVLGSVVWFSLLWLWCQVLERWCQHWHYKRQRSFLIKMALLGLRLLTMNLVSLAVIAWLLLLLWIASPPGQDNVLFVLIFLCAWIGVKISVNLAWLLLSDRHLLKLRKRSKTYRHFVSFMWIMGVFTVITALTHTVGGSLDTPLSQTTLDIIDTLFMLSLSWMVLAIMRVRYALLNLIKPLASVYWFHVLQFSTLLIPLSLIAVTLLGVLGYINLGWYVAQQLSIFVLVLSLWMVARGLLNDSEVWLKNLSLRYSNYSLLWTQDVIPLLKKLMGIVVMAGALWLWFFFSGWLHDIAVMQGLQKVLTYQWFTLGGSPIHLLNILIAAMTLWLVFWFGSWCKQVTYRWIYSNINDLGARHSLSVFTQYTVVLIGLIITLQLIGIDLTTVTVFAGALGVGIGFGLQNIANNFISGILLLLERPLRTGDYVNVASQYEGEVTHIGIRALTIRAWNHQEVIVPNSELISNAFTNWTHSDNIMRTTWHIRIGYNTEPAQVLKILQETLMSIKAVLQQPEASVTIWEFAESWMLFRLDYYIDIRRNSLFNTRTELALKSWANLKQAGIHVAYPQQDIHMQTTTDKPLVITTEAR